MAELDYFHILRWKKNEENQHVRKNLVFSNSGGFTLSSDVPIIKAPQTEEREVGYRSEVVFAVSEEVLPALHCLFAKKPEVQRLCTVNSELDPDYKGGWLMRWDDIKWYESDTVINDLVNFIDALESDDLSDYGLDVDEDWYYRFKFVRIGEDHHDVESKGSGFDDIQVNRAISY